MIGVFLAGRRNQEGGRLSEFTTESGMDWRNPFDIPHDLPAARCIGADSGIALADLAAHGSEVTPGQLLATLLLTMA